ncbi:MAG TPA: hypothetical protein VF909_05790 [Roseiflexaceae bacterium]
MERAAYQPDLRPRTLPELLDLAFRLYRTRLRHYLSMIAFLFLGLAAFGLNYLNMGRLSFDTWLGVFALGMAPPLIGMSVPGMTFNTAEQLQAAFGREFFFADGTIFWTIGVALRRGWGLVRHALPRSLAMFGVSLALVRLAAAMPFVGLLLIHRAAPELPIRPGRFLLPLALLTELLVYPVAQIAVTLLYYDLRIRREGFDIALAARCRGQEVANIP